MTSEKAEVQLLIKENIAGHSELFADIAKAYMIVFGNTEGVNEGGLSSDRLKISLNQYFNCLMLSDQFFEAQKIEPFLQDLCPRIPQDTLSLISLINWLNGLEERERESLLSEVEKISDGYRPYYTINGVMKRFEQDLTANLEAHPLLSFWNDTEYPVCGFLTGVVADTPEAFWGVVNNVPYLDTDIVKQARALLESVPEVTFPLLFEHEGAVIPERRGREKGSKWSEVLFSLRRQALEMGASHLVGFTFTKSGYYKNGIRNRDFTYDFLTNPYAPDPMHFFVTDLRTSVAKLQRRTN